MWPVRDEWRKHRAFREVWAGYLLGGAYLLFNLIQYWRYGSPSSWFEIQQDIYLYGNMLTAFLIVMGLPRLMCCEQEYGTVHTIRVSERGTSLVWRSKALFTIVYCAAVVAVIGVVSLLFHGGFIGFRDALGSVAETAAFGSGPLPLSNLAYCALQYVFLFLGAVYFAGFVLLVAQLTQRTTFTIFLCGGVYLALLGCAVVGRFSIQEIPQAFSWIGLSFLLLQSVNFAGFMAQQNFSHLFIRRWDDIWKPVVLVILLIAAEFGVSWLLWKRRAQK